MWNHIIRTFVVAPPRIRGMQQRLPFILQLRTITGKLNIKQNNLSKVYA